MEANAEPCCLNARGDPGLRPSSRTSVLPNIATAAILLTEPAASTPKDSSHTTVPCDINLQFRHKTGSCQDDHNSVDSSDGWHNSLTNN